MQINGDPVAGQSTATIYETMKNEKLPITLTFRSSPNTTCTEYELMKPTDKRFRLIEMEFENLDLQKEDGRNFRRDLLAYWTNTRAKSDFWSTLVMKNLL